MEISVKVDGLDRIHDALRDVQESVAQEIAKALFASAKQVEGTAKKSILSGGKSGRTYKRRTVVHRASAPGEAPASDTGRLVNSINSYLDTTSLTSFVIAGRGTVKYAAMLEFGTSKIAPRPFMFPALEQNRGWIKERLDAAVRKAAMKAGRS